MVTKREEGQLYLYQTYFKLKIVIRDKESHNDKRVINSSRRPNDCKYLCIQHQNTSIYKANNNRTAQRNKQQYNNRDY